MPICRQLLRHDVVNALSLARANTGSSIAARMAMMAMTTSNSIKVNAFSPTRETRLLHTKLQLLMGSDSGWVPFCAPRRAGCQGAQCFFTFREKNLLC